MNRYGRVLAQASLAAAVSLGASAAQTLGTLVKNEIAKWTPVLKPATN